MAKLKRQSIEDGLPPARDPLGWIGGDLPTATPAAQPEPQDPRPATVAPETAKPATRGRAGRGGAQAEAKQRKPDKRPAAAFRLDPDIHAAFYELARAEGIPPAQLAELAISRLLADIEAGRYTIRKDPMPPAYKLRP